MQTKGLSLPDWYPEEEICRILHAENWNYTKTHNAIANVIIPFRYSYLPIKLEEIHVQLLKSGFIMIHGRDKHYRPIIYYRPMVATRMGI
jgi:hypothetical protein